MRYMMIIKHTEDYRGKAVPPALLEAVDEFVGENMKNGKIVDGNGRKRSTLRCSSWSCTGFTG